MQKILLFCLLCLAPVSVYAAKGKSSKYVYGETIHVPLDEQKWKVGHQKSDEKGSSVTRYFIESESPEKWTKLINIQFKDRSLYTEKNAVEIMSKEQEKSPLAKWKILNSTPDDILYERSFPTGEEEIVRILVTKNGVHRIAYVTKKHMEDTERREWIDRLSHSVAQEREKK